MDVGLLWVLGLLAGCATTGAPRPEVPTAPTTVHVDGLYGGRSVGSEWNTDVVHERLAARVVLEAAALRPHDADSGVEPWTLSLLLGRLNEGGAELLMEPLPVPASSDEAAPQPTMAIRSLRFRAGQDGFAAIVNQQPDGALRVGARHLPTEESLCGPDWSVPLGFVVLRGAVQRWPLGEVAAVWDEIAVASAPVGTLQLGLPPADDPAFCGALADALAWSKELRPGDGAYLKAATTVLEAAVGPLLPVE